MTISRKEFVANEEKSRQCEEAQAVASAALLDFAMNSVREAAFLIDDQARFSYVNAEACRILGYRRDELLRCCVADVDPDFPKERWETHWTELRAKGSLTFEGRHRAKDGRIFPVEVNASFFEYDGCGYNLALVRDISERRRLERNLYEQSRMLEGFFAHALTPLAILDREFNFVMVNAAYAKAGGRVVADFPGHNHFALYPHAENEAIFRQVVETRIPFAAKAKAFEYADHPEWGVSYWDWTLTPLLDEAGEVEFLVFSLENVTTQQQALEAARTERQRLYDVLETLPVYVILLSPDHQVRFANQFFRKRFGELDGRRCYEYLFGRREPCETCETFKVLATGQAHRWAWTGPDGRNYDIYDHPFSDSDGTPLILEVGVDVTELKQAADTIREREAFIRSILETVDEGFIVVDRAYRVQAANRAFCDQVGQEEERLVGEACHALSHHYSRPCFEAGEDCPVRRTFESGSVHATTHIHPTASGEKRFMEVKSYPMTTDAAGRVLTVIETVTDVTGKKRLEERLAQAQKLEAVGRLAGGVAHDFNNMLNVILGYTDFALSQIDPAQPLATDLTEIRKAAVRSADLTRQLLAFARKQNIAPRLLDLNETVEDMLKMLRRLIGEDIELHWRPAGRGWLIRMDPSQVDQLLANLCLNARDAIAGVGRISIETANVVWDEASCDGQPEATPGDYVQLAVSDNGCGMDQDVLARLFEPFFTTKEMGRGTGLGLATVYGIVRQNSGFIRVYSEPGQGTTFRIYLPRQHQEGETAGEEKAAPPVAGGDETILLVEDEPALLVMTKRMLEKAGYQVLPAATPEAALQAAGVHRGALHLLITDVVMPGMNGRELAERLQASHPGLRYLFMSGYTDDILAGRGILDRQINFLQKPFSAQTLSAKVREVLGSAG